jgi:hypothetical protein
VVFCAFCNLLGWGLSAIHELTATGYAVAFLIATAAVAVWMTRTGARLRAPMTLRRFRRRFRRGFPLAFLVLGAAAILGGFMYAPNNYDALAYRVPRVLHWLAAGQWHWINTIFNRVNPRGCGVEWLSAPMIAFLKTDRWLFLINVVSFLLLPGLFFSVFTRLGAARRVAWAWMWVVPTGYCYVLQAGGIGNDLPAAVFPVAGLYFALRADNGSFANASLAVVCAALTTAVKLNNLPLALPVAVALLPNARAFLRKPLPAAVVVSLAVFASAIPTAYLNWRYCGDWSGAKVEALDHWHQDKLLRIANNTVLMSLQNLEPPVFPIADKWRREVLKFMPEGLHKRLVAENELAAAEWSLPAFQWEVNAGLGAGVSVLLLAGLLAGAGFHRSRPLALQTKLIVVSVVVTVIIYLASMALEGIGRLAASYYPLVIGPCLLFDGWIRVVRRFWWKALFFCSVVIALGMLVINPSRPLWPALTVLQRPWQAGRLHGGLAQAAETYYNNRLRPDALSVICDALPPESQVIGLISADEPETSLWRPFGKRRVVNVTPELTHAALRDEGIHCVVVSRQALAAHFPVDFDHWLAGINGEVRQTWVLTLKGSMGPSEWDLVVLKTPDTADSSSPR